MARPRLIAFDLDGTLWAPEMYELWGGGGAPFSKGSSHDEVVDRSGTAVQLLGVTKEVLHELHNSEEWAGTQIALVSTCDEPSWAQECLKLLTIGDGSCGTTLKQVVHQEEIYCGRPKSHHFQQIRKRTKIDFKDMIFFDNQQNNCTVVKKLGVCTIYCPEGLTEQVWQRGLEAFRQHHR
eukprot:m.487784 g.487784  ORF g.487784 m.487784 type:complete len:180 (-) comp25250_c0_seq1:43-582(-)